MHCYVLMCIILLSEVHDVSIIMHSSCRYYGMLSVNTCPFGGTETDMVKLHLSQRQKTVENFYM